MYIYMVPKMIAVRIYDCPYILLMQWDLIFQYLSQFTCKTQQCNTILWCFDIIYILAANNAVSQGYS